MEETTSQTNSDPGALGGAPGLKCTEKIEETKNEVIIPLNAWALEPGAKETRVVRTDIVRISTTQDIEAKLFELAKATRELILREFERRSLLYEKTGKVDTSIMPAYRNPSYFSYKEILGSANFEETLRFISERFKSFKEIKKMEKLGRLPAWMKPNPPKNFKPLIIIIRYDNYKIDSEQRTIKLGYYGITLNYKGNLRWWQQREKQGRLMLIFNEVKKRWYAHISSYIVIERDTNSGYKCGIDLGQKILATVALENGHVFMYKGSRLAWDYKYFKERISRNDKLFDLDELDRD
jgi:putative transposase